MHDGPLKPSAGSGARPVEQRRPIPRGALRFFLIRQRDAADRVLAAMLFNSRARAAQHTAGRRNAMWYQTVITIRASAVIYQKLREACILIELPNSCSDAFL